VLCPPDARRIHVDKGYRGHNHAQRFRVWISGQVRRVTVSIRREMRRRAAVEPVIGHMKAEHRMSRDFLKGRDGDRCNAVLAAAGYNFSLILIWRKRLLRALIRMLLAAPVPATKAYETFSLVLHGRLKKSPVNPTAAV
jgi:transposase, IS5 family